jgi:glycosyltransferase involved in cell wall biosynthesis
VAGVAHTEAIARYGGMVSARGNDPRPFAAAIPAARIIFVNRFYAPDQSATSRMLTDLATALAADGSDVHVVTSRLLHDDASASLASHEVKDGVVIHRVRTTRFGRSALLGRGLDYLSFHIAAANELSAVARDGDVIVAKTDPPLVALAAARVARKRGARLVNWLQDVFPEAAAAIGMAAARGPVGWVLRFLRDRALRRSAATVVLGEAMRQRIVARGIDPAKVIVISNWADGAKLRPTDRASNALRERWGLAGKLVVGYSGNMGRAHSFGTVLDAADVLSTQSDVAFVFIGGGMQKASLERAMKERKLTNVHFKPYQPQNELEQSLGAIDAHLVTLRPELEGLVVPSKFYGIAAVGRPTVFIGDPAGEIGTVIRKAECGFCVTAGDVAGLVAAILRLRDDPGLAARMGANARRVFDERFDKPIAVARWRCLLHDVAAERLVADGPDLS